MASYRAIAVPSSNSSRISRMSVVSFRFSSFSRQLKSGLHLTLTFRFATALALATFSTHLAAEDVRLAWDPSADTNVVGYALYFGTASGDYSERVDVGNQTTGTCSGLVPGVTYYFVAVAYNANSVESLPSNEVSYTVPDTTTLDIRGIAPPNSGFRLTWTTVPQTRYRVVYTDDLTNPQWTDASPDLEALGDTLEWVVNPGPGRQRFYAVMVLP